MMFMVQDLLDFAQLRAGKFRKMISTFNIRDAVESVMCIQRSKALDSGISFYATFENFGEHEEFCDSDLHSPLVQTDEARVKQVLLGLQSNALKFTKEGKVEIRVSIIKEGDDDFLKL